MSNPKKYTVGWICAITTEFVAAQTFLDDRHEKPESVAPQDSNSYALGSISGHNVVIAVLPQGEYGTNSAAVVARDMLHSFPNVRVGLMVGIGGGAPTPKHDIRLGDIVVSCPRGGKGGVLQYDFGKTIQSQAFQQTGFLNQPPQVLRAAVAALEATYEIEGHQLDEHIESVLRKKPRLRKKYSRPQPSSDRLYKSDIVHPLDTDDCCNKVCGNNPLAFVLRHERDGGEDDNPAIHYGLVASANQLMKDALVRDRLAAENDVLCFEMEAAGLMNHFPCLVIRGICDYSDSHKNNGWQGFAAMAAAAYAKDLLSQISASRIEDETRIGEVLKSRNIRNIQSTSNQIANTVKSMKSDSHVSQIKDWLSPPDTSTNFNHAMQVQLEGTCTWFLKGPVFKEWKSGLRRHLWLHGMPGCGKTILCAKVLHHLEDTDGCVALNFFFDFSDAGKQKLEDLLRSLIFQLYKHGGEAANELDGLLRSHQDRRQPETTALATTFQTMMKHSKKVYIVLDALDECTTRDKLLARMKSIISNPDFGHVQLLAASRPEGEFQRSIPVWIGEENCKQLDKESVTADIRAYIEDRLEHSPEFRKWSSFPSVLKRIRDEVGSKAGGMFRWAACQLESLEACLDREGIESALQSLPRDLSETYSRILQQIPQQRKMKAIRLLQFLFHSDRPLRLEEAVDVVAVRLGNGQRSFDVEDRLPCPADIMRFCPSLVSITRNSYFRGEVEEVQLAHFSVKEYLQQYDVEGFSSVEVSLAITHTCLTYLTNIVGKEKWETETGMFTKEFPLAEYAAMVWTGHAKLVECADGVVAATVSFLSDTKTFRLWSQLCELYAPW
ncbi:purine and uridine phosphorylase, partial [Colletotrichum caudatum]